MTKQQTLTKQQEQIIAHVGKDMPALKRAIFEAQVLKMLRQNQREGDQLIEWTVRACVDAMQEMAKEQA